MEKEDKDKDEMVGAYVCGQGGEHKGRGRSSVRFAQHPAPSRLLANTNTNTNTNTGLPSQALFPSHTHTQWGIVRQLSCCIMPFSVDFWVYQHTSTKKYFCMTQILQ